MANKLPPLLRRDFRMGRITPETLSPFLVPENSVKDSLNVTFDEIVGSPKVRAGTTVISDGSTPDPGTDGFLPQGIADFSPGSGSQLSSELVTNGTFTGSASGWTLGGGWSYGTNNALFTYLGVELVTNGSFTGSAAGWTLGSGWAYVSNNVEAAVGATGSLSQSLSPTIGNTYRVSYQTGVVGVSGGLNCIFGGSGILRTPSISGSETFTFDILTTVVQGFSLTPTGPPFASAQYVGRIDNISVKLLGVGALSQDIGALPSASYLVSVTATGSVGYVNVAIGSGTALTIAAGATVSSTIISGGANELVSITASSDFNGAVDNVSVKQVLNELLVVVYNGVSSATVYYWNGTIWNTSNLIVLTNGFRNRFTTLGGYMFLTNSSNGMYSSPDANTWTAGIAANCIDSGEAKPAYIFRYKQRLLAAGDPTYPDRVFFSSVIDPTASPFITWNTDSATGDWIDVNPDDGGNITGFSENSTFCLVFKNTGMYRMDTVAKTTDPDNIYNVGAVSQEAIVLCQGVTYFFSGTGVYRTNGGYPELISRNGVQDIIDALDPSNWADVSSGTDGFNVFFSLGQVTMHKNQSNERTLDNVVIKFSVRDQSWSVHTYRDFFFGFTQYTDGNGQLMRGASDAGFVQTIDLGTTDAQGATTPAPIYFSLETQDIECGDRSHSKAISNKIAVFTDNGLSSTFAARIDGNADPVQIPMTLTQRVNVGTGINLQGNFFNFLWYGTSSGNPPIFEGFSIEDISDQGMGSAQGESEAPIVTTPLT